AGKNNGHSRASVGGAVIPDLCVFPLRRGARRAILRSPVEGPGVVQIFARNLSFEAFEDSVFGDQVWLQVFLAQVVNGEIDFAVEFLQAAISISRAQPGDRASTGVSVHSDQTA